MSLGCIHIYTGNGKGKTTAALGVAIRAFGAQKRVFIGQFIKSMEYSEVKTLHLLNSLIDIKLFGQGCFLIREPNEGDIIAGKEALNYLLDIFKKNIYEVIILDEIIIALYLKIITKEDIKLLLKYKPAHTELILTGRYAPDWLIDMADLVTEMKEIKHYYSKGIENREGIDK